MIDWKTVKKRAEKLVLRESEKRSESIAAAANIVNIVPKAKQQAFGVADQD